jgi:hypothetical protein
VLPGAEDPGMTGPDNLLRTWLGPQPWLEAQIARVAAGDERALFLAMGLAGRKVGRAALAADAAAATALRPGWTLQGWSADQAARTLLVLALPAADPARWLATLDRCFHAATVEELVALYQSLPLLPHPALLAPRAAEGVRNAMSPVFAAVALDNPFPAEQLGEQAFNQMVLKCFFCGCDSARIHGLAARANAELGRMLAHYARERRIAGRVVDPALPPLARRCGADCLDNAQPAG